MNNQETNKQMTDDELLVKNRLFELFSQIYNQIDEKIATEIDWNERRGIVKDETIRRLLDENQPKFMNDEYITNIIVGFKNMFKNNSTTNDDFINYLATEFTETTYLLYNSHEIKEDSHFVKDTIEPLIAYGIVLKLKPVGISIIQNKKANEYSLETIQLSDLFKYQKQYEYVSVF